MTNAALESKNDTFGFELLHLSPSIGTEVHGIRLDQNLDDEVIAYLADLLVERKVIFFRDQPITVDQHIAFARRFGDIEIHPFTKIMSPIQKLSISIMTKTIHRE